MVKSLISSISTAFEAVNNKTKSSILNQYMDICKDVLTEVK